MLTPYSLMDDITNSKNMGLLKGNELWDLGMQKYMFNRWLSMTSLRNLLVADALNNYDSTDDIELMYAVGSVLSGHSGKYKYLKKKSEKRKPSQEREWGDEITNRERAMYSETLDFLENANE